MPARTEIRAIAAAACALGLLAASIALAQAPRWPDADDIERARKAHPFPQADRLGAQPVPAPPRVHLPPAAAPTDIEALARAGARLGRPSAQTTAARVSRIELAFRPRSTRSAPLRAA